MCKERLGEPLFFLCVVRGFVGLRTRDDFDESRQTRRLFEDVQH